MNWSWLFRLAALVILCLAMLGWVGWLAPTSPLYLALALFVFSFMIEGGPVLLAWPQRRRTTAAEPAQQ
jgi:hypothetical protein